MDYRIITRSALPPAPVVLTSPRASEEINSRLPTLPNEMWLQISEWATFVPDILDFDTPKSFKRARYDPDPQLTWEWMCIRRSLVTKFSLVRVCRRWHVLAIPLLYQVVIVSGQNLCTLHRALKQSTENSNGVLLGSLVRRLDVHPVQEDGLPMLGEIFGHLSRIRILIADSMYDDAMAQDTFKIIASKCGPTLQKPVSDVKSPLLRGFLERLPNLRTFCHPRFCSHDLPPLPNLQSMTLNNFHDVCSANSGRNATISYPNLRLLLLHWDGDESLEQTEHRTCALEFLSNRAPGITTVHLETTVNISQPVFKALAEHCPHLTHIILNYDPDENWTEEFIERSDHVPMEPCYSEYHEDTTDEEEPRILTRSRRPAIPKYRAGEFPLITHLTLLPRDGDLTTRYTASDIFPWVASQKPPSLEVVRFSDGSMVNDLRTRYPRALARGLKMLSGVRVEDHEGNDMRRLLPLLTKPRRRSHQSTDYASDQYTHDEPDQYNYYESYQNTDYEADQYTYYESDQYSDNVSDAFEEGSTLEPKWTMATS